MSAAVGGKNARLAKDQAALAVLEAEEAALNLAENPVPSDEAGDEPSPEPIAPPTPPEPKPEEKPEPRVHQVPPEPEPRVEPKVDWKKEAEILAKRKADADAALGPFQQVAAHERKRAEALENKLQERDSALAEMKASISELKALIASIKPGASVAAIKDKVDEEDFDPEIKELVENFPEVARVSEAMARRAARSAQKVLDEKISGLETERETRKKEDESNKARAHFEAHHKAVVAVHPDVDEIYREASGVLAEWANEESPEYLNAVKNPLSVSPGFFIKVLREFKASLGHNGKGSRVPSKGDIAVRSRSVTVPSIDGDLEPEEVYLTDDEFKHYPRLMQNAINKRDVKEQKRLEEGYENTARRKENE